MELNLLQDVFYSLKSLACLKRKTCLLCWSKAIFFSFLVNDMNLYSLVTFTNIYKNRNIYKNIQYFGRKQSTYLLFSDESLLAVVNYNRYTSRHSVAKTSLSPPLLCQNSSLSSLLSTMCAYSMYSTSFPVILLEKSWSMIYVPGLSCQIQAETGILPEIISLSDFPSSPALCPLLSTGFPQRTSLTNTCRWLPLSDSTLETLT